MYDGILETLRSIVGAPNVLTGDELAPFQEDWRKKSRGEALAAVRPATTEEVARVVQECQRLQVAIVPQGGNTSLAGGSVPDNSGRAQILLQLARMNHVREMNPDNLTVTVESGCILENLQAVASAEGLLFPLSLGAEGSCMIGGNLATNAGGTQVLRYGNARDLCLGLEVVTPNGDVIRQLSGLRKDNTGYDLRDLFIGSEGTLGIITAATMKLFPKPASEITSWVTVEGPTQAVSLLNLARRLLGAALTGFELMGEVGLAAVAKHMPQLRVPLADEKSPYSILIECASDAASEANRARVEQFLEAALEGELIGNAVVAETIEQCRQLWHIRESIPLAQAETGPNIKHDVSLPISRIPDFLLESEALLSTRFPGVRIVAFGHLGDGNLHYNVMSPNDNDHAEFTRTNERTVNEIVFDAIAKFGGSFSAEHGIGASKTDALELYKCPVSLKYMKLLKQAFDPNGLMNPGRVLNL